MNFDAAFVRLVDIEKGLSLEKNDRGNWSGGQIGLGVLKGTKYGVSAASYPDLDIASLTLQDARAIYLRDFWYRVRADELPDRLRYPIFDLAVNSGAGRAIKFLQQAIAVKVDGDFGPLTMHALKGLQEDMILRRMDAYRLLLMADDPTWKTNGRGWVKRVAKNMLLVT